MRKSGRWSNCHSSSEGQSTITENGLGLAEGLGSAVSIVSGLRQGVLDVGVLVGVLFGVLQQITFFSSRNSAKTPF